MNTRWILAAALALGVAGASPAYAKKKYKNLKVLADNGKTLKKGMKNMTKGLGVKCKSCHVKGKWDSDEVEAKVKSRDFFQAVVGESDQAKKDEALAELMKLLELDEVKDAARIWKGVGMLEKKK